MLKPLTQKSIGLLLISSALIAGLVLDRQPFLSLTSLSYCYTLVSVFGVLAAMIPSLLRTRKWTVTIVTIVAAVVVWRISFFPNMVIAGYLTTIIENLQLIFTQQPVIYPALFLTAALLHAFSTFIAIIVIHGSIRHLTRTLILIVALPLALLASAVSFIHQNDFQFFPFNIRGNEPLAVEVSLPSNNPYIDLLRVGGHSWQETTLFYAGLITYELIPDKGSWSQHTKGTLEQDLRNSNDISSRYFTISHLNAFWLARK